MAKCPQGCPECIDICRLNISVGNSVHFSSDCLLNSKNISAIFFAVFYFRDLLSASRMVEAIMMSDCQWVGLGNFTGQGVNCDNDYYDDENKVDEGAAQGL